MFIVFFYVGKKEDIYVYRCICRYIRMEIQEWIVLGVYIRINFGEWEEKFERELFLIYNFLDNLNLCMYCFYYGKRIGYR